MCWIRIQPPPHKLKRGHNSPQFSANVLRPNGWMDQDSTWYGGRPRPRRHCVRGGPAPPKRGTAPTFSGHSGVPRFHFGGINLTFPVGNSSQLLSCPFELRLIHCIANFWRGTNPFISLGNAPASGTRPTTECNENV